MTKYAFNVMFYIEISWSVQNGAIFLKLKNSN